MRVRVDLQSISASTFQTAESQANVHEQMQKSLVHHQKGLTETINLVYQQVDRRIGDVEELLKNQSKQLQASQFSQMGHTYGNRAISPRRVPRTAAGTTQHTEPGHSEDIGIRVQQYPSCRAGCSCKCHVQSRSATPRFVDRVLGQMFVGYVGLPLVSPQCDTDACEKAQNPHISVEYWFPLGFLWSQIFRLQLSYQPNVGPNFELSSLRRIPDSAQCINFALDGNIDGLKDLFKRGLASPRDVSSTRGYSILRVSLKSLKQTTRR